MKASISTEKIFNFILLLICVYSFFGYLLPRSVLLIVIALLAIVFSIKFYPTIKRSVIKNNILLFAFLVYVSIGLFYTTTYSLTVKFATTFFCMIILKIFFENSEERFNKYNWQNKFLNYCYIFSSIHIVGTLLMNFFPDIAININSKILSASQFEQNLLQHNQGLNAGICDIYGINAFYVLIFCGISMSRLFFATKKKTINAILFIIGVISLILVGKRGALLCFAVTCCICFILAFDKMSLKKRLLIILGVGFMFYSILFLMQKIPATQILFTRLEQSSTVAGMMSGREILYQRSIDTFNKHYLFGVGIKGIYGLYEQDGHNIYLQLLAEAGILGAPIMFAFFVISLISTIKYYSSSVKSNINKHKLILFSVFYQISFLIYGLTENSFYLESILLLYLLTISFCSYKGADNEKI